MGEAVLQVICGGLGTFAFAFFFHVRSCHLPVATLGGVLSWTIYLLVDRAGGSVFLSSLVAAIAICLWSETMARVRKAPANVFLLPGIVPLLPGGALYYTMDALVNTDMAVFIRKGKETGFMALGIVGGILIASELFRLILWGQYRRKKRRERESRKGEDI